MPIDERRINVAQAYELNLRRLKAADTSPAARALAVCWIMHLVGDSHQPVHTIALFSEHRFSKGERGGNLIKTAQSRHLHSL